VTDFGAGDFFPADASDPEAALRGAPADTARILLAHQPRSVDAAVRAGVHLQLSGHTHGGQFFPWNAVTRLGQPYLSGLHRHGGTWIYVNTGCGYWGPPLRLGIPPEVTVITLVRAV
jgi:predicted MPP superfamily phosphohydrolase